jgi:hypothetical protein
MLTDVSEVRTASIIRAMSEPRAKGYQVIKESKWTGPTNGECMTIGEEAGQWQMRGQSWKTLR